MIGQDAGGHWTYVDNLGMVSLDHEKVVQGIAEAESAFSAAGLSVSTAPTARAHTILARLTTFLESRDEGPEGAGGVV